MPANNTQTRVGLFVLGMHRSGTSALTGTLQRLGAELGDNLLPARPDNPKGFWENADAMEINEALLKNLGTAWSSPRRLPTDWLKTQAGLDAYGRAVALLEANFADSGLWGLKDPRICQLAPLWFKAAAAIGSQVACILIVRSPREVMASLQARDELPAGISALLWLQHVLAAEFHSRGYPRLMVTYDQLLSDWRDVAGRVEKALGIQWPNDTDDARAQVDAFLSGDQRHHVEGAGTPMPLLDLIEETYSVCCDLATDDREAQWDRFEGIRGRYFAAEALFGGAVDSQAEAMEDMERRHEEDKRGREEQAKNDLQFYQAHIEKLNTQISSLSGKLADQAADVTKLCAEKDAHSAVLARSLEANVAEAASLRQAVAQCTSDLRGAQSEKERLQTQVDSMADRIEHQAGEIERLSRSLEDLGRLTQSKLWLARKLLGFGSKVNPT